MQGEDLLLFGIPLAVFLASLFTCFSFGKQRYKKGLVTIGVLLLGFTVAMLFGIGTSSGWDGLGYLFALIGIGAPAGLGASLGGLVGWFKKEQTVNA